MLDGRHTAREVIRESHVLLEQTGFSRNLLFLVMYALHIFVPIIATFLYVVMPAARPVVAVLTVAILAVQLYTRTCPLAKLEWALVPCAEQLTWRGADFLKSIVIVDKRIKFYFMIASTVSALVSLWLINKFL